MENLELTPSGLRSTTDHLRRYRTALQYLVGIPVTDTNRVDVLRNGDQAFPAMLEAVSSARSTIDLETFGHWNGSTGEEFASLVADRADAGVRVRVLLDALGGRQMDKHLIERMAMAGARVRWFRPLSNWRVTQSTHRGHRKLLICDNRVGFAGGTGFADQWRGDARHAGEWRDTSVRLQGPAVNGLLGAFINNWAETGQPLFEEDVDPLPLQPRAGPSPVQVVRGDAETGWGDISTLVRSFIALARRRLRISASYFVPDATAMDLLCAAARRGVSIEVLRPGPYVTSRLSQLASQAQYDKLLEAGVRVWSFQPSALQAKVITVDGSLASIGPANFNSRSLTLDDEVNVVVIDRQVASVLDSHFDADLVRAEEIDPSRWSGRGLGQRAAEAGPGFLARRL